MKAMKAFPELPEDIIVNILSRLPVKYVIQLKCVCKPWLFLISDPQFAKLHLTQSQKNFSSHRVLLITQPLESAACEASNHELEDESKLTFELEYPAAMMENSDELVEGWLELSGSCNGLICAVFEHERVFLWNPTIREAKELAKLSAFDPKGKFSYGLGYDFSTDDYQLIRAARSSTANANDETQVEVLALKTNIWRKVQALEPNTIIQGGQGIFLHGAMHWLAEKQTDLKKVYKIIAFNMVEEKFYEVVAVPDHFEENMYYTLRLGISGDCLCLFYGCGYVPVFEAWVLNNYSVESSWKRLFTDNKETLQGFKYWENALCYTKTGKVVIDYDGRDLVWYDPIEKTSKTFTPRNEWDWFQSILYVESMVSPNKY